jgi:hypothetical protein
LSRIALPPLDVAVPHVHVPALVSNDPLGAAIVVPSRDRPAGLVTVTVVDALAVPVVPVQARLNVRVLVSAPMEALPETARAPDQPPDAEQELALVEDQASVDAPPLVTDVGFAVSDTVGMGEGLVGEAT